MNKKAETRGVTEVKITVVGGGNVGMVIEVNPHAIIIIISTIPVGYTEILRYKTGRRNILFRLEFLRETKTLYDNLYPSRIIIGTDM